MIRETSRISVPAESEQATIVRQFVRLACHRYGCDAVADNVLQVTDELMGLALARHASTGDTVDVGIVPMPRGLRVEVHEAGRVPADPGAAVPPARLADQPAGMQIVESLATDWGVDVDDGGRTVWVELADEDATSSSGEPG